MSATNRWISGKVGYVLAVDEFGVPALFSYSEWTWPMEIDTVGRRNFRSGGYHESVGGFKEVKPTVKGPWALEDAPVELGVTYTWFLGIEPDGPTEFLVDAMVKRMTPRNNAEGAPEIEIELESQGPFSITSVGGLRGYGD